MANVSLRHIYKIYDGGVTAVTDLNLEIEDKEFIISMFMSSRDIVAMKDLELK